MLKKKVDSNYEYIYQWMNKYKDDTDRRGELLKEWRDMMLVQKEKGTWDSYNEAVLKRVQKELANEQ